MSLIVNEGDTITSSQVFDAFPKSEWYNSVVNDRFSNKTGRWRNESLYWCGRSAYYSGYGTYYSDLFQELDDDALHFIPNGNWQYTDASFMNHFETNKGEITIKFPSSEERSDYQNGLLYDTVRHPKDNGGRIMYLITVDTGYYYMPAEGWYGFNEYPTLPDDPDLLGFDNGFYTFDGSNTVFARVATRHISMTPVYAEIIPKSQSHYMIVEPDGGAAFSEGEFYSGEQLVFSGKVGEAVDYPSGDFNYRKAGYKLDGWSVFELNSLNEFINGAMNQYWLHSKLTPTVLDFDSYWIPNWVEAPYQEYTVHYDPNGAGATGEMASETFTYNGDKTFSYPIYYYPHHRFDRWTTNPDGTGTALFLKDSVWRSDILNYDQLPWDIHDTGQEFTVYAQWTADSADAKYDLRIEEGAHSVYRIDSVQVTDYYTHETNTPTGYIHYDGSDAYMTYSGDTVTVRMKPFNGYVLNGIKFETDHYGILHYVFDENGDGVCHSPRKLRIL